MMHRLMTWLKNKYILALILFVILSAFLHLLSVLIYVVKTMDFGKINYFKILQMDLLFPTLTTGSAGYILSLGIVIFGYVAILLLLHSREKVQS